MRRLAAPLYVLLIASLPLEGAAPTATSAVASDFAAVEPADPLPSLSAALAGLAAPALAAHIRFLAAPALGGRGLGTPGLDAAAEYAAASLALARIPPLGPAYFQAVPLREISAPGGGVTVERRTDGGRRGRVFAPGTDCVFARQAPQEISAPVVFAGYGIREDARGRDDYRGLDVRGAIVLVLAGVPAGDSWRSAELTARYAPSDPEERWDAKLEIARSLGAAAVLGIESEGLASDDVSNAGLETPFFLPHDTPGSADAPLFVRVSAAVADAILGAGSEEVRQAKPGKVAEAVVTVRAIGKERLISSRSVIGALAGSDPRLRDEAVVIGAHLDHLGKVGDKIYPGADDDASGVSALIEIAKAFAELPARPRRTVVFAFWTGEEEGKLGSGYYVRHPLWPLARTAAYLNLDMIGHPWSRDDIAKLVADSRLPDGAAFVARVNPADFVEPGVPPGRPELDATLRRAARATGIALHFDRTDGLHGGSDYREFARAGVPFIRFFGNFFPGYHEPGDTADALDPAQVQRVARLALVTAWLLADR